MKQSLNFLAMSFIIFLVSCSPTTKEDYLNEYSEFIVSVEEKSKSGDIEDWTSFDKKHKYYTTDLYDKFEDDLALGEVLQVGAFKIRYEAQKHKSSIFENIFGSKEIDEIGIQLKDYIANDLNKDVDKLINEAQKVSDEFGNAVKELADELQKEVENVE